MKKLKLALHWQMLIALAVGVLCGWVFNGSYQHWGNVIGGVGKIFLNAINMIVIPLVFLSTLLSISNISDTRSMGRVAWKSFLYFVVTALLAATIGVVMTDLIRPGFGVKCPEVMETEEVLDDAAQMETTTFMDMLVEIVPSNVFEAFSSGHILPIIFFAILLGLFITKIEVNKKEMLNRLFDSLNDAVMLMTKFIIRFAPLGVFAIVMGLVGGNSDSEVLKKCVQRFVWFVGSVWVSLIVMGGIALPVIVWLAKVVPTKHMKQVYASLMLAFSTCSSYSALPLLISDAKTKLGISDKIANFTIPLGITFNKIGTVIYECVAVIFVSQAWNMPLSVTQQITLVFTSVITVFGAPSVPMAGVLVLAVLLNAMGLPTDCIGVFMAIDLFCDMPKTLLNAYSVSCGAVVVARSEGESLTI